MLNIQMDIHIEEITNPGGETYYYFVLTSGEVLLESNNFFTLVKLRQALFDLKAFNHSQIEQLINEREQVE